MTKTRVIAALVMAPVAIAAILLLPTQWLVALVALVFLIGMWEWFKLAEIDDTLSRTVLLIANLLLMVLLVWASAGSPDLVPLRLVSLLGVCWISNMPGSGVCRIFMLPTRGQAGEHRACRPRDR